MTLSARLKCWHKRFWLSTSAQRLAEALSRYLIQLPPLIQQAVDIKAVGSTSWASSTDKLLDEVKEALEKGDEDRGWHCFLAVQRMELRVLHAVNPEALQLRGQTLCGEALDKLKSWRKERVQEIRRQAVPSKPDTAGRPPSTMSGPPSPNSPSGGQRTMSVDDIVEIADILHGHFDNEALKRRALGRQLVRLLIVALTVVGLLVLLSLWPDLRPRMDGDFDVWNPHLTIAVMLFGLLGASLSGILSTLSDPGKVKIPELLFSFRVTLARLVVGMLSAVVASVMLASGFLKIGELKTSTKVILLAALVAGFSERLVTGALKKAAGD